MMNAIDTVLRFMELINQHNVDKLSAMMSEDHVFIDSLGQTVRGQEKMARAWGGYYAFCPDYRVTHEEIFHRGNSVAVIGSAEGTVTSYGKLSPENKWRIPAAWFALVENGLVKEWRVYADNKPVYDIMAKLKAPSLQG